jgi:dCMP deaminase
MSRYSLDETYMRVAEEWATRSYARRKQVGAVIVNPQQRRTIAEGYNGTPTGFDNNCEVEPVDSTMPPALLTTSPYVLHAELNALMKVARSTDSTDGCTMYVTLSPCIECSKMIIQAGIKRILFREKYRIDDGVEMLRKAGITVEHLPKE